MKTLSIDIETYSPEPLVKCGVYRYCQAPEFEILLFGYSVDSGPVQVVDLAAGERIPADVLAALTDPAVSKWAFNAQFERVCLSRYLGYPVGRYLDPDSWYCTMVWSATLGLPLSLEGVGAVLGLEKQKLKEGKDLVRYFCTPAKARDGSTFRRIPADAPEKWISFKAYNLRDVETEMSIQQKLSRFPVSPEEWDNYHLDQRYTSCEKRTAKRPCYCRGVFAFFIAFLPYVTLIFFILHPPSIQQILSSLCTGKGREVYANR